jgi:hypothetical protein
MVTSYSEMVWLTYVAAMRRSSILILSMSIVVLYPMNRTSSGAESGSPVIYDLRRAVFSNIVLVEGPDSWISYPGIVSFVSFAGRAIIIFVLFEFRYRFLTRSYFRSYSFVSVGYYYAFLGQEDEKSLV